MKEWFCVRTKSRQERIALERLKVDLGVECFLPMVARAIRGARATQSGREVLFPGYLFVRLDLATEHRKVKFAFGVLGFVQMGNRFPALSDCEIELLKRLCDEAEQSAMADSAVRAGDSVELVGKLFGGTCGTVKHLMSAKNRVRVLIEFLSRSVEFDVPSDAVIKVRGGDGL